MVSAYCRRSFASSVPYSSQASRRSAGPPRKREASVAQKAICASAWANTAPHGGLTCASASAFAAVPVGALFVIIERTKLGAYLRAGTENPALVQAFGINVPRMITLTYALGVGLAGLAGVLSAPINQVRPLMGADLIIVVFAVVVIGGMGSIMGAIVTGFGLGITEGLTKVFFPEASNTVIFIIMAIVLLIRPAGLFGRAT